MLAVEETNGVVVGGGRTNDPLSGQVVWREGIYDKAWFFIAIWGIHAIHTIDSVESVESVSIIQ